MAEPNGPNGAAPDQKNYIRYLVPAGAVAALVVLVGLVIAVSTSWNRTMSDGSDGTANDPGLKELTPGVRYRDIKVGEGDPCPPGATVLMHYTGWLENGDVFDSTKGTSANPRPGSFPLEGVIAGWQEGVPGMKPGGIRKLVIAPEKGYGATDKPKIPAHSTLIFELELVEVATQKVTGLGQPMPFDSSNGGTDDPGLKDLGGGLKYRDLKEGTGEPVKQGASVLAHYTGWLVNGTVFDSSLDKGKPIEFSLKDVVKGWQQGIPGMRPGGVRKLVIPADLGYGASGKGRIPAGATLIFEVRIVE